MGHKTVFTDNVEASRVHRKGLASGNHKPIWNQHSKRDVFIHRPVIAAYQTRRDPSIDIAISKTDSNTL